VDALAQTLLPGAINVEGEGVGRERWGVVAELYKLNVSFFSKRQSVLVMLTMVDLLGPKRKV